MNGRINNEEFEEADPVSLSIDTSGKLTSIALARGERVIASIGSEAEEKRSERLWTEISFLLRTAGLTMADVKLLSVCVGPGGFTGLRVGIAAAKGLAAAGGIKMAGVSSLEAAAFDAIPAPAVCAMINAYKGEVYSQLFSFDDRVPVAGNEPAVSTITEAIKRVSQIDRLVFAGSGAVDNLEIIKQIGGERFCEDEFHCNRDGGWIVRRSSRLIAEQIARLGYLKLLRGEAGTAENLRACYVRQAEAQVKLSKGMLGSKIKRSLRPQ